MIFAFLITGKQITGYAVALLCKP